MAIKYDISFNCASCSSPLEAPPEMEGEEITCPQCSASIRIPGTPKTTRKAIVYKKPTKIARSPSSFSKMSSSYTRSAPSASPTVSPVIPQPQSGPVGSFSAIASILCFVVGSGMLCAKLPIVYFVPFYIASFFLSILSMANGRIVIGFLSLLITISAPYPLWQKVHEPEMKVLQEAAEKLRGASEALRTESVNVNQPAEKLPDYQPSQPSKD